MSNIRRSMMMAGRGGKPYDAQVEYLQSSGTQYIDTGYYGNLDTKIECKVYTTGNNTYPYGSKGDNTNDITLISAIKKGKCRFGNKFADMAIALTTITTITQTKTSLIINGTSSAYNTTASFTTPSTLYLMWLHSATPNTAYRYKGRIYYMKIWENDVLVRDYIPVRIGTTGYMYDQVSGTLYGNDGTGDFTLGNDIN